MKTAVIMKNTLPAGVEMKMDGDEQASDRLDDSLRRGDTILFALHEHEAVGFAGLSCAKEVFDDLAVIYMGLEFIFVTQACRGKGFGALIRDAVLQEMQAELQSQASEHESILVCLGHSPMTRAGRQILAKLDLDFISWLDTQPEAAKLAQPIASPWAA